MKTRPHFRSSSTGHVQRVAGVSLFESNHCTFLTDSSTIATVGATTQRLYRCRPMCIAYYHLQAHLIEHRALLSLQCLVSKSGWGIKLLPQARSVRKCRYVQCHFCFSITFAILFGFYDYKLLSHLEPCLYSSEVEEVHLGPNFSN